MKELENLREIRKERGLTQAQIANILHVAQNTYSQYELGIIPPNADVLCLLAEFFGVSSDFLLGLTPVRKPYPKTKKEAREKGLLK